MLVLVSRDPFQILPVGKSEFMHSVNTLTYSEWKEKANFFPYHQLHHTRTMVTQITISLKKENLVFLLHLWKKHFCKNLPSQTCKSRYFNVENGSDQVV